MSLKPKKFLYEESEYFGKNYLIELTKYGLELQRSTVCIPFTNGSDVVVKPTSDEWKNFIDSVKSLKLKPKEPKDNILDGFEVKCHITFNEVLVKFYIINPEFENFEKFRYLVNSLTICNDYPKGVLDSDDEE